MPSPLIISFGAAAANGAVGWACSNLVSPQQTFCKLIPPLLDIVEEAASLALQVQLAFTGLGQIVNGLQGLRLAGRLPQIPVHARRLAEGGRPVLPSRSDASAKVGGNRQKSTP